MTWIATSRRTLRVNRSTYTDLSSTGNLRLIGNPQLRDRIVGLYESNDRVVGIRDRVGVAVDTSDDRLWDLPAAAPERTILANNVWFRGFVSYAAILQLKDVGEGIRSVRDEITAELARRRPG